MKIFNFRYFVKILGSEFSAYIVMKNDNFGIFFVIFGKGRLALVYKGFVNGFGVSPAILVQGLSSSILR